MLPGTLVLLAAAVVRRQLDAAETVYLALFTLGIIVLLGTFMTSLSNRRRTLQDRLARTVLVPR